MISRQEKATLRQKKRKLSLPQEHAAKVKPPADSGQVSLGCDSDSEEEIRFEKFIEKGNVNEKSKKTGNDNWNTRHIALIQYLEKKGSKWRDSSKPLSVWKDMIMDGQVLGV